MKTKCVDLPSLRRAMRHSLRISVLAVACALTVTSVVAQPASDELVVYEKGKVIFRIAAPRHATSPPNGKKRQSTARLKPAELAPEPPAAEPPPPPPPPLTPERMPPKAPQVYWDGKQLTINSDNSTLADILTAIRNLTGAELDIPTTASRERFAARLGPGPAREVLSTLLSWSDFDYVIQASDANPAGVQSVLLTPRVKNNDVMVAKGGSAENPPRSGYRGYTRPNPSPEEAPAPENTAAMQSEGPAEPSPPSSQPGSPAPQPATAAVPATTIPATTSEAPAVAAEVQPAQTDLVSSAAIPDSSATQAPLNETEQRVQQMQDLFQQRKQMMEDARKPPQN